MFWAQPNQPQRTISGLTQIGQETNQEMLSEKTGATADELHISTSEEDTKTVTKDLR